VKGYRKCHREAQKRYREKEKGKQKRRELEKNRRWRVYRELENTKSVENKKKGYEVEDCYGNGNGNGNGNIQSQSLYTQVQVRSYISNINNDKISAKRKKLGEKVSCHLCGCEGIIVEKFHRHGYYTKSSCA
jgi:hypothetical protein